MTELRLAAADAASCRAAVAVVLALALVGMMGRPATAEEPVSQRVRDACMPDARRLCPDHKLGSPQMRYCMQAKQRWISRDCQMVLEDDGVVPRGYFQSARR